MDGITSHDDFEDSHADALAEHATDWRVEYLTACKYADAAEIAGMSDAALDDAVEIEQQAFATVSAERYAERALCFGYAS